MKKQIVHTKTAPAAIGPYSQAIRVDNTVYLSGQIPLDPLTMELVKGGIEEQSRQVFKNLKEVASASGFDLLHIVKLTIYLVDMDDFPCVNKVMSDFFEEPYPSRSTIGVASLPKAAKVEIAATIVV